MFRDIGTVSVTVVSVGKHSKSYAGYVALQALNHFLDILFDCINGAGHRASCIKREADL